MILSYSRLLRVLSFFGGQMNEESVNMTALEETPHLRGAWDNGKETKNHLKMQCVRIEHILTTNVYSKQTGAAYRQGNH